VNFFDRNPSDQDIQPKAKRFRGSSSSLYGDIFENEDDDGCGENEFKPIHPAPTTLTNLEPTCSVASRPLEFSNGWQQLHGCSQYR
jgi:hypothetical protein